MNPISEYFLTNGQTKFSEMLKPENLSTVKKEEEPDIEDFISLSDSSRKLPIKRNKPIRKHGKATWVLE